MSLSQTFQNPDQPLARPPDRCPHSRSFRYGSVGCRAFQAVTFLASDSMNRPIGKALTCSHLRVGDLGQPGHFYARCDLGTEAERLRWLESFPSARFQALSRLQVEFELATRPARERLLAARVGALHTGNGAQAELAERLEGYLESAGAFLTAHESEFGQAGLPSTALMEVITEWAHLWADPRNQGALRVVDDSLAGFPPRTRSILSGAGGDAFESGGQAGRALAPGSHPVYASDSLRITRLPAGLGLAVHGAVDLSNAEVVSAALLDEARRGSDVRIDLSGLAFCDLSGLRALVRVTGELESGHAVVVTGMPAHLSRAMEMVGWAELPNFRIEASHPPGGEPAA